MVNQTLAEIYHDALKALKDRRDEFNSKLVTVERLEKKIQELQQSIVQPGTVLSFAGFESPNGEWLLCDGSAVSRVGYATLFKMIGETYGSGDGSTTFNLPDLRGRTAIGAGQSVGLSDRIIGQAIGEENHALTIDEMPSHSHAGATASAGSHSHTGTTDHTGSHSHTGTTDHTGSHSHAGTTERANPKLYRTTTDVGEASHEFHQMGWKSCHFVDRTDSQFSNADHTHNFTTSESDNHAHNFMTSGSDDHAHNFMTSGIDEHLHTILSEGNSQPQNNMQPSLILSFIIKT